MGKTSKNAALQLAMLGLFVLAGANPIVAGPAPVLEVDLEAAEHVFVGQIVSIEDVQENNAQPAGHVHQGRATITVKEVLKGKQAKSVEVFVATRIEPYSFPGPAAIAHICRVGDVGIWLIDRKNLPQPQMLPEGQKTGVVRILDALNTKKWSKPVNGLRAWAVVVNQDLGGIIVAVNNASKGDVCVPLLSSGKVATAADEVFCTVKATGQDGKTIEFGLDGGCSRDKVMMCQKLSPGETTYLHLDYRFRLGWRQTLTPGKYSVTITVKNEREDGKLLSSPSEQIKPWKGELKMFPVEFVLTPNEANWKPSQIAPGG